MAKRGVKLGITYVVALITSFFLFGFIGWVYIDMLTGGSDTEETPAETGTGTYAPSAADERTVLAVVDYGAGESDVCFMLIRFLPQSSEAAFFPVPANTYINGDGDSEQTLFRAYRDGSVSGVKTAVSDVLGLSIDKYIVFDAESFGVFCDFFGSTNYTIPEDIVTAQGTVVLAGDTYLDRQTMRVLLTNPNYKGGEEERARRFCEIVTSMLNKELTAPFVSFMDTAFNDIINSGADTDISRFDYEESEDPIRYTLEQTDRFCRPVFSSGTPSPGGNYVLDPDFITALYTWFNLN
jgi:anionic cell wall polymer biosynthesis LytR-Cps2A-Psr (LCP) family protein